MPRLSHASGRRQPGSGSKAPREQRYQQKSRGVRVLTALCNTELFRIDYPASVNCATSSHSESVEASLDLCASSRSLVRLVSSTLTKLESADSYSAIWDSSFPIFASISVWRFFISCNFMGLTRLSGAFGETGAATPADGLEVGAVI